MGNPLNNSVKNILRMLSEYAEKILFLNRKLENIPCIFPLFTESITEMGFWSTLYSFRGEYGIRI